MRSSYAEEHGDALSCSFDGKVSGDDMSGTLDMGEYLSATWTAKRHQYRGGRGAWPVAELSKPVPPDSLVVSALDGEGQELITGARS